MEQGLLKTNIECATELLVNSYYDEAITEPTPFDEWVSYVYREITTNFDDGNGCLYMGNQVLRFFGKENILNQIKNYIKNCDRIQEYIKY